MNNTQFYLQNISFLLILVSELLGCWEFLPNILPLLYKDIFSGWTEVAFSKVQKRLALISIWKLTQKTTIDKPVVETKKWSLPLVRALLPSWWRWATSLSLTLPGPLLGGDLPWRCEWSCTWQRSCHIECLCLSRAHLNEVLKRLQ